MKGVVLAGSSGTRLHPLTLGIPKQLIPIYDRPMVCYAIDILKDAGIIDIQLITTNECLHSFKNTLGDGSMMGVNLSYQIQESPKGIAQAISIAEDFIGSDSVCLITGDTIIYGENFKNQLLKATKAASKSANATIFVDKEYSSDQYGRVIYNRDGSVDSIIGNESSKDFLSISGIYVFPNSVINRAKNVKLSERMLYEITDVNKGYFEDNKLQIQKIASDCIWFDTNTPDNLLKVSLFMQKIIKNK